MKQSLQALDPLTNTPLSGKNNLKRTRQSAVMPLEMKQVEQLQVFSAITKALSGKKFRTTKLRAISGHIRVVTELTIEDRAQWKRQSQIKA